MSGNKANWLKGIFARFRDSSDAARRAREERELRDQLNAYAEEVEEFLGIAGEEIEGKSRKELMLSIHFLFENLSTLDAKNAELQLLLDETQKLCDDLQAKVAEMERASKQKDEIIELQSQLIEMYEKLRESCSTECENLHEEINRLNQRLSELNAKAEKRKRKSDTDRSHEEQKKRLEASLERIRARQARIAEELENLNNLENIVLQPDVATPENPQDEKLFVEEVDGQADQTPKQAADEGLEDQGPPIAEFRQEQESASASSGEGSSEQQEESSDSSGEGSPEQQEESSDSSEEAGPKDDPAAPADRQDAPTAGSGETMEQLHARIEELTAQVEELTYQAKKGTDTSNKPSGKMAPWETAKAAHNDSNVGSFQGNEPQNPEETLFEQERQAEEAALHDPQKSPNAKTAGDGKRGKKPGSPGAGRNYRFV